MVTRRARLMADRTSVAVVCILRAGGFGPRADTFS